MVELDCRSETPRSNNSRLAPGGFPVRRERHRHLAILISGEHRAIEPHLRALHDLAILVQRGENVPRRITTLSGTEASLAHEGPARYAVPGTFHHVEARLGQLGERQRLAVAQYGGLAREIEETLHRWQCAVEVYVAQNLSLRLTACRRRVKLVDGYTQLLDVLHVKRERHVVLRGKHFLVRPRPVQFHALLNPLELFGGEDARVDVGRGLSRKQLRLGDRLR